MAPADAIVILTIYAALFSAALLVQLRRDVEPRAIADLLIGTLAGTPLGVWGLAALPASALNRLIGLMLVVAFVLESRGLYPERLRGRGWGLGAGVAAGVLGGAVGTPGPTGRALLGDTGLERARDQGEPPGVLRREPDRDSRRLLVGGAAHPRGVGAGRGLRAPGHRGRGRRRAPVRARRPAALPSDRSSR
jgi:hypothetical protein